MIQDEVLQKEHHKTTNAHATWNAKIKLTYWQQFHHSLITPVMTQSQGSVLFNLMKITFHKNRMNSNIQHNVLSSLPLFQHFHCSGLTQENMPFVIKNKVFFFDWRRACLPETVSTKTKLREFAAVEVLAEKEGSQYIMLYIRFQQDVFEPPVGPKNNFENRKNQQKGQVKIGTKTICSEARRKLKFRFLP